MKRTKIPSTHPRATSLRIREMLVLHHEKGIVATAGLMAHGRGEAFDYLLGERTTRTAFKALRAAAATLLTANCSIISVNGNVAALVAQDIVKLARVTGSKIEVNLFHRTIDREEKIKMLLEKAGAESVLGVSGASARISGISSERGRVDPKGILDADVVLVPLEDGDRTEALVHLGKKVIAIDLNPLSRTAQLASITVVDNIVRAMPALTRIAKQLKEQDRSRLHKIVSNYDNRQILKEAIGQINERLSMLAEKGTYITTWETKQT